MSLHLRSIIPGCLVLAAAITALLINPGAAHAAGNAVLVTGEVEVADSGVSPADLIVNVHAGFGEGFAVVGRTQPDGSGRYVVELPLRPNNSVFVSVSYEGVTYFTDPINVPADGPVALQPITVFPTTDDESVIRVESSTIVIAQIDPQQQQMTVLEMMTLVNESTNVYIGDKRGEPGTGVPGVRNRTLTVDLPEGAGSFQIQRGLGSEELIPSAGKFYFTEPVFPGRRQIVYSYQIGYPFAAHLFARPLSYQTTLLRVLMPEIGARVDSPDLEPAGLTELQGRSYQMLFGTNLSPGTVVRLQVSGLPVQPAGARLNFEALRILTVGLLLLALGAIGFYTVRAKTGLMSGRMPDRSGRNSGQQNPPAVSRQGDSGPEPSDE